MADTHLLTASVVFMSGAALLALSCGSDPTKLTLRGDGGAAGVGGEEPVVSVSGKAGQAPMSMGGAGETSVGGAPLGIGGEGGTGNGGAPNAGAGGEGGVGSTIPLQVVYNTGVDDSGVSLPGGSIDPHWTLIESADPTFAGPDAIVTTNIANDYWVAQSETSKWIAPSADQSYPTTPNPCDATGTYVYRTTFTLTSEQVATFALGGQWGADNYGIDILLNDVSTGTTNVGYTPLTAFTITTGFVAGLNTLDFEVNDIGCPTGLRVELAPTTP